jgi:argininosuccinate lyase
MSGRPGFPTEDPAPELVEAGFAPESADAPFLHHGLNLLGRARELVGEGR